MIEWYIYIIVALLPLTAVMLVRSQNPYHALVIRGILGAVAALVYAVLGAADVALTEALVGTMLAITLYAVAVRSSLVLRVGVEASEFKGDRCDRFWGLLWRELSGIFDSYYLRLELVTYASPEELHQALRNQDIHAIAETTYQEPTIEGIAMEGTIAADPKPFIVTTRVRRIYELMQTDLVLTSPRLLLSAEDSSEQSFDRPDVGVSKV
ncbi:MAG: putative multicomponent Na+:H+ antiporter subunit B [Phormidium sp. OSCR]|nr:MAG: putative multicomponent Na+:H+ antiporter subunit B [Phormidium sp. OSCR]